MGITFINPKKALNTVFYKLPVLESEIQKLSKNLSIYIKSAKEGESEEYHKGLIKDFFANTWYSPSYPVNTNGREDLVIFNGNDTTSKPAVIIEAKSPTNTAEMFSGNNYNCKALQECVYYFLQENLKFGNNEIKHIIITNYEDFYIFDAKDFSRFFLAKTNPIVNQFNKFEAKQLADTKTSFFYENCAKPAIEKWIERENICVTHVTPKTFYEQGEESLIPLYKIFSPEHLLAKTFANDSNSLDRNFYAELLHIIGLEEIKDGGKKLIQRKSSDNRDSASLIESTIYQLEEEISNKEKCFETALHLVITWVNRLLFLKLVESQQVAYQKGNVNYKFLTEKLVPDFDELNILFFKVLGRKIENRDSEVREKYKFVPYLNSSLFEISEEESRLQIRGIKNKPIKLYSKTVLKDEKGKRLTGSLDNLAYIFRFLDAYNFSSDSAGGITQNSKTLINASVLGLIFEKINGYKDGSFFTPSFITEYMAKETVERAVIQKFNEAKGWKCKNLDELADEIDDRVEANEIFNTIRICDPAVGSGHFLVSVLNRLLFIKSYLNILIDKNGKRIKRGDWELRLENDEISILDDEGNPFVYTTNSERQRVQETIFAEKRTIIENCLFGVDINPASVYICRLRLWIELLKNTYYTETSGYTQLETLPNIDINIKCGNSLVSKYNVCIGSSVIEQVKKDKTKTKEFKELVLQYKEVVSAYKNENNKETKRAVEEAIRNVKSKIRNEIQFELFDKEANEKKVQKEDIFRNSLEWMFEFPELLDDDGRFIGFDAVIGNPPYFNIETLGTKSPYAEFVKSKYKDIWQDKSDILFYFFRLAMLLSKETICFITSNAYMFSDKAQKLRNVMFNEGRLRKIVNFEEFMVFPEASITTCITLLSNDDKDFCAMNLKGKDFSENDVVDYIENPANIYKVKLSADNVFALVDSCISNLNAKIDGNHKKLNELFKIGSGMQTAANKVFCFSEYPTHFPKEFVRRRMCGEIIDKYIHSEKEEYMLYFEDVQEFNDLPQSIQNHLNANKETLSERATVKNEGRAWWRYSRPMHKEYYHLNKIWCSYRSKTNIFALDESTDYIGLTNTTVIFDTSNELSLKYLLALLNSKLLTFRYKSIGKQTGSGVFEYFENGVGKLPIPSATSEQQNPIIDLVDKILVAKKADNSANTSAMEAEIDRLVYSLYGLTEEEIKIVEGR